MLAALFLACLCAGPAPAVADPAAEQRALLAALQLPPEPAPAAPARASLAIPATSAAPEPAVLSASTSSASWIMPGLVLLGLAGAAFYLAKRRAKAPQLIQVLETAGLGPKRALVLARVGAHTLLLGTSEAGISLLTTLGGEAAPQPAPARPEAAPNQASLLKRLIGRRHNEHEPNFDDLLAESAEDQELRQKLEAGISGRVS